MRNESAPKQTAIYWKRLLLRATPRGKDGDFHQTKGGMVLEVTNPVSIDFYHSRGKKTWQAEPGDVLVRVNQPADEIEIELAHSLTGTSITHATVAERFSDLDALNTALRQNVRHIPKALLGRVEIIRGHRYRIPGSLDLALDEAKKKDIKGQYGGVISRARELRRIQIKIERGFKNAYQSLIVVYRFLETDTISVPQAVRNIEALWKYLNRVATFKPYYSIVHNSEEVQALQTLREIEERKQLLNLISRALPPLEKGFRGIRVQPKEIRSASGKNLGTN